jgi:nucleotide-binding universal stress UspA family protein
LVLICYDGSLDAQAAIDRAGELLNGQPATVLTVWEGFTEVLARTGAGLGVAALDTESIDTISRQRASERANEGAARAKHVGLSADPRVRERRVAIWETILAEADDVDANVIVLGSRGLTGLKSLLLGSVSHAVVQHSDRPVIVVPSPEVAARRAARRKR